MQKKVLILGLLLGAMCLTGCNGGGNSGKGGDKSQSGGEGGASSQETTKGPWTVKFDTNGGKETYPDQVVEHKGLITDPGTPTRSDEKGTYTFVGWRYDGASWSFKNSKVTCDMTLTARWIEKYAVNYLDAAGQPAGTVTYVDWSSPLAKPADPTAPSGQKFYGWMNTLNGGQIWNFDNEQLNKVMSDVTLKPLFVPDGMNPQVFEAEECPDFTLDSWGPKGMPGATYSGGQNGLGLVGKDFIVNGDTKYGTSGHYTVGTSEVAGFAHFLYIKNDTLTWELESDVAATNVTMFMRLSAEYGIADALTDEVTSWVDQDTFPVTVNGTKLEYGKVTLHNIIPMDFIPFQDYFVSANISLQAGKNIIQMKVDNLVTLNGTIASSAPVVDCIKLYSSSTITWPGAMPSNLNG